MDIDITYSTQLRYNESSTFCFLATQSKNMFQFFSDLKKMTFINYRKMKKSRPLIFSMNTYSTQVSIQTKGKFHGFIHFYWLHGQNNMFQP